MLFPFFHTAVDQKISALRSGGVTDISFTGMETEEVTGLHLNIAGDVYLQRRHEYGRWA